MSYIIIIIIIIIIDLHNYILQTGIHKDGHVYIEILYIVYRHLQVQKHFCLPAVAKRKGDLQDLAEGKMDEKDFRTAN